MSDGWKLVPVEPTVEMQNAAIDVDAFKLGDISPLGFRMSPQQLFARCYQAMLAASPTPPVAEEAEAEPPEMALLRGRLSQRATSAEFNEWQALEIVAYVDRLGSALSSLRERVETLTTENERLTRLLGEDEAELAQAKRERDRNKADFDDQSAACGKWIARCYASEAELAVAREALRAAKGWIVATSEENDPDCEYLNGEGWPDLERIGAKIDAFLNSTDQGGADEPR
jgi:hypothetical protein